MGVDYPSGDVLSAEIQASSLIALPMLLGGTDEESGLELDAALVGAAGAQRKRRTGRRTSGF